MHGLKGRESWKQGMLLLWLKLEYAQRVFKRNVLVSSMDVSRSRLWGREGLERAWNFVEPGGSRAPPPYTAPTPRGRCARYASTCTGAPKAAVAVVPRVHVILPTETILEQFAHRAPPHTRSTARDRPTCTCDPRLVRGVCPRTGNTGWVHGIHARSRRGCSSANQQSRIGPDRIRSAPELAAL